MPLVSPFRAIQFTTAQTATSGHPADLSTLLAPPYDVLDQRGKDALLARNPDNIVAIDLPHLPAKQLGPDATYAAAAQRLSAKMADGTFARRPSPVMFAYRQTFTFAGKQHQRTGLIATIDLRPFGPAKPGSGGGGGVLPHEQTFSGPKEDRLALMRATRTQLSPIFGLLPDDHHHVTNRLAHVCKLRQAQVRATSDDGTLHELWAIDDQATLDHLAADCREQDVFIADGHHRYTTALNYLAELEKAGPVAPDHPARRCMFVLVSMHEPGLVIGPTHRILAGMKDYSWEHFERASKGILSLSPVKGGLGAIEHALQRDARKTGKNELGLYDFESQRAWLCTPTHDDPLRDQFPDKPMAWRTLDVALCQHLIVERICQPKLNAGQPVQWAFPHSIDEVHAIGQGQQTSAGGGSTFAPQLAVIVDPTPLSAVRDVSRANELMPQKSTFFFPKLATGLAMHALA